MNMRLDVDMFTVGSIDYKNTPSRYLGALSACIPFSLAHGM